MSSSSAMAMQDCESSLNDSPYIPVDSWVYPALWRLYALGYIDTIYLGMRPYTRSSVDHMLEEAALRIQDADTDSAADEAQGIYESLKHELHFDTPDPCGTGKAITRVESVYSAERAISGTPLRDSFHLGSTIINDYGRPYEKGFNDYTGASGYASAGHFQLYARGEVQGTPSGIATLGVCQGWGRKGRVRNPISYPAPETRMRWRARSIRHAAEFPRDGEAALRPLPGISGMDPVGAGQGGAGLGSRSANLLSKFSEAGAKAGPKPGMLPFSAKDTGESPESHPKMGADSLSGPGTGPKTRQETGLGAQPSSENGVPEDMATLVLDKSAMGAGAAARLDSTLGAVAGPSAAADPNSDAAIMLRVAAGDEAGFNYLAQKYHRAMIHFLFRMVHNEAVAEELAQEVFLRVYRSRESYRAEAKFTTWLYRIATNLAVNHARDTKHERSAQTIYLDAPDPESGTTPDVADDEPSVEQRLMRDERMAAIRTHVMALPDRQRMAVLMHKYQGMDYRQIGDVLKLSESATKSLLFRAYQTLRDKLKEFV